jgi:hypothetical protein
MFLLKKGKETSMSWSAFPLIPINGHEPRAAAPYLTFPLTAPIRQLENVDQLRHLHQLSSLGSASAGTRWQWVGRAAAEAQTEGISPSMVSMEQSVTVSVPVRVKLKMAQVARANGRSEGDLWAEAANTWLTSHTFDDEPLPPAPATALAVPSAQRSWDTIDELLTALRRPTTADQGEARQAA